MRILYLVILVFVISFAIFFPAIGMHFCSDDFYVIKRLCIDKVFWTKGFFRPIGELSLLLDYKIIGFNPALFHITNIIIHAINTCLVFSLCSSLPFLEEKQKDYFSYLATILFLTYPFHLESILWIVSRSSALGTMFGTLTLISYFKLHRRPAVYFVV
jgi:hypothetical protein